MRHIKKLIEALLPPTIRTQLLDTYHRAFAFAGALLYGLPSRKLIVIGVTGTKGKSSVVEMINAIFEEAGKKTALTGTIRIKIGDVSEPNLKRMSMPGRFFMQHFFARAVAAQCDVAIVEMTSEGARQHRHRGIDMNALVFTNISPEHIESHGSYEAYAEAKLEIGQQLVRSHKRPRIMVANAEDQLSQRFLTLPVEHQLPFTLESVPGWSADENGGTMRVDDTDIHLSLPGAFSLRNALAAITVARAFGIPTPVAAKALEKLTRIPGRAERIEAGQNFTVVVDYAHTPDSLTALYEAYAKKRKICVLGSTGGGRDLWKRPVMGAIADEKCDHVILTNEDPYDEDPRSIVDALARGMKRQPEIIMDRSIAIRRAIAMAEPGDAVLITGKGTDPCICGPNGSKVPWSDARVAKEEIERVLYDRTAQQSQ